MLGTLALGGVVVAGGMAPTSLMMQVTMVLAALFAETGHVDEFDILATAWAKEYFSEIADSMVRLYAIPRAEAVDRINRAWHRTRFVTDMQVGLLGHALPDHWAKRIYEGDHFWAGRRRGGRRP